MPRGKVRSSLIFADHVPFGATSPPVTVKVELCPSMEKVNDEARVLPLRSMIPDPLLEVRVPPIVNTSPAVGFAWIGLTVRLVGDLIVIVVITVPEECNVDEPLNKMVIAISPRG